MTVAGTPGWAWRVERAESHRLALALAFSLVFHLAVWGGYEGGKRGLAWVETHHPSWIKKARSVLPAAFTPKPAEPKKPEPEPPLMFVDVNPAVATPEPPLHAKFESSLNSVAANPNPDKDTDTPKIDGNQTEMLRTEDVTRKPDEVVKLTPVLPSLDPGPEMRAKPTVTPGDLAVGKPDPKPAMDVGDAPKSRPRTLAEALARQPQTQLPGLKMKQDGGVRRDLAISALDVRATPFGAYQAGLVAAIAQRWYALLDERSFASEGRGKVAVKFALHYDGTITGVKIAENTTGSEVLGYVCVKAIEDPAPYEAWPAEMRREISKGVFDIQFTFFYH